MLNINARSDSAGMDWIVMSQSVKASQTFEVPFKKEILRCSKKLRKMCEIRRRYNERLSTFNDAREKESP
jgi:hypothetical protein